MIESLLNQLSGLLTGSKHEGGAKAAASMLRNHFSYPKLTGLLPWRMYDDKTELYINSHSLGFIMEVSPLAGANKEVVQGLDDLLRKKMPRKTPVTVLMVASKCVGDMLDEGLSKDMWKGSMAPRLNSITKAFWERASLCGLSNRRDYPQRRIVSACVDRFVFMHILSPSGLRVSSYPPRASVFPSRSGTCRAPKPAATRLPHWSRPHPERHSCTGNLSLLY